MRKYRSFADGLATGINRPLLTRSGTERMRQERAFPSAHFLPPRARASALWLTRVSEPAGLPRNAVEPRSRASTSASAV